MATFSVLLLTAPPPGHTSDRPRPPPGESSGPFVKVDGREVLLRSVELFLNRDSIKQIQLCFLPENLEEAKRKYAAHLGFSGVKVISGGPKWIDQIGAAAASISDACTHVIVHDVARPAVPYSDIDALMDIAEKHAAVALAAPVRSALVEVDEGGNALAIHPAGRYMQLLTPQVFAKATFAQMAGKKQEPHPSQLALLKGSALNVRLSGAADTGFVKSMINMLPKPKVRPPTSPFEEAQW